jgi:hypothetical protein
LADAISDSERRREIQTTNAESGGIGEQRSYNPTRIGTGGKTSERCLRYCGLIVATNAARML